MDDLSPKVFKKGLVEGWGENFWVLGSGAKTEKALVWVRSCLLLKTAKGCSSYVSTKYIRNVNFLSSERDQAILSFAMAAHTLLSYTRDKWKVDGW